VLATARLRKRIDRRREPVVAQRHRLEIEGEIAELANRRPRPAECPVEDLACLLEIAAADQVERRVDHQRDAGERLHGTVVEEEGDPAPLILLRREHLLGELAVGVVERRVPVASR